MSLRLLDTLTREVKPLTPEDGSTFRFYCCGPTVYGAAHIGNFRTFLLQDVLRRTLEAGGMPTLHVRNLTDVDDKTIRQSQAEQRTLKEFTDYWTERFHADCSALGMLLPHHETSAVDHIPHQIELIEKLIQKGFAYEQSGSVYFRVSHFKSYGRLSRLHEREITTTQTSTGNVDSDEYERESATDFALWKVRKPEDGENYWQSPWGEGRPGWHIECSAMAMAYLGETMDLHSGGVDLIFPHHENEIAQSEAVTCKPFARHWFHIAHLLVENRKMSKSLGNLFTLEDIRAKGFSPMDARYVLISAHYRQPLNFTWDSMQASRSALEKMAKFDATLKAVTASQNVQPQNGWGYFEPAWQALQDDLNTPKALGEIFTAIRNVEVELKKKDYDLNAMIQSYSGWTRLLSALGLDLSTYQQEQVALDVPNEVKELAQQRWQAKAEKNWALADQLRQSLKSQGWDIKDKKDGYDVLPLSS